MALHFAPEEYASRLARLTAEMAERKLDALLVFSQESMYWLTGYDGFGYAFFQCLVVTKSGRLSLVARSADIRQARRTSIISEILMWTDRAGADPTRTLKDHLFEVDLLGCNIGVETATHGLTAKNGRLLDEQLRSFGKLHEASDIIPALRAVKSEAEIKYVRKAAELADTAWHAGLDAARPGAAESDILAAMQGAVLAAGGDYSANPFVIGSGADALLIRYKSGRRTLGTDDQMTIDFAGVWHHYHVAMLDTVVIGTPRPRHRELYEAAEEGFAAITAAMRPGNTVGDVYNAHAKVLNDRGMQAFKLNACGYSLGATFAPTWMDVPMFYNADPTAIVPNMVLFAQMILMDSETDTAMAIGRSFLTTEDAPEALSAIPPSFLLR